MIKQKKRQNFNIFKLENTATSTGDCSSVETLLISTNRSSTTEIRISLGLAGYGFFSWSIDARCSYAKQLISTVYYVQNIDFEEHRKETALYKATHGGQNDVYSPVTSNQRCLN